MDKEVELLICKCASCTHWEIGRVGDHRFLLCRTCGLEIPIVHLKLDDHHMLHWEKHKK